MAGTASGGKATDSKGPWVIGLLVAIVVLGGVAAFLFFRPSAGPQRVARQFLDAVAADDFEAMTKTLSPDSEPYAQVPAVKQFLEQVSAYIAEQKATFEVGKPTISGRRADIPVTMRTGDGQTQERTVVAERVGGRWRVELLGAVEGLTGYDVGMAVDAYLKEQLGGSGTQPPAPEAPGE